MKQGRVDFLIFDCLELFDLYIWREFDFMWLPKGIDSANHGFKEEAFTVGQSIHCYKRRCAQP